MCIWCAACEGGSSEGWLLYKQDWARSRTKHARAGTSPSRISSWQYVSQVSRAGLNPVSRVSLGARSPVKYVAVERAQGPARELISKGSEPGISQGASQQAELVHGHRHGCNTAQRTESLSWSAPVRRSSWCFPRLFLQQLLQWLSFLKPDACINKIDPELR